MLNSITITGRMTRDPELKQFPSGEVLPFTLACTRDYKDKKTGEYPTDFIDCVTWKHSAVFLGKYANKGDLVQVSGRLEIDDWTDKEGNKRRSAKVNATIWENPEAVDEESGLAHYKHMACNLAFICDKMEEKENGSNM